jgi:PAS domain S-box-containing protein
VNISFSRFSSHLLDGEQETGQATLEQQSSRFMELSLDLLGVGDFNGYLRHANPAYQRILGYTGEELVGQPWIELIHPGDRNRMLAETEKMIASGGETRGFEARVRCKDGSYRTVLWDATASPDERLIYAVGKDITERKRLEEQSTRFMELSLDPLGIVDFEGCWGRMNPALEQILGRPEEELAGQPYLDFIHPDDQERVAAEALRLATEGGETRDFEARLRSSDGSYRTLLLTAHAIPDEELLYVVGRDVTEDRRAEAARHEAEERFEAAFEQAPIGMALVSIDRQRPGCFLRVNRSLCEITGLSEPELIGTDFRAIAHPDEVESDIHYVRWMLTGDIQQYEVEKRLRHADGHTLWALITVSVVMDAGDRPLYLLSQIQDITARKEAEHALWESRERLQDIIDNTTAVIYLKDRDGRYLLVNDRFELLYDHRREEVVGKTDHDLFPPETADALRANDLKALATGIALEVEEVSTHEDGAHTYLSTRFPLFHSTDPKGPPYAVCTIANDITERKRAEEALRASEEHFRRIVNTAHVAFVSIDANGVITAWNPQAEKIFGWPETEAVGHNLAQLIIPPRYREAHRRGLEQFLATGRGPLLDKRIEIEATHRAGHEFPVELAITPVRIEGEYAFNAFLNDISERRSAEENVRQLANIVESSGDAIIGLTPEGVIRSWNPGAERLYGYSAQEALGKLTQMLLPEHRSGEEQELLSRVLSGDRVEHHETERVRKDGGVLDVSLTVSPIKDAVGTVVGISSVSRDITERKRADRALRQTQEGFRSAFENAPIGMALFSIAPEENARLLEVNGSLSRITGYSIQQLLEMDLRSITHPEDRESERPLAEQLIAGEIPNYQIEKRYLTRDGSIVWVTHNASTVSDSQDNLVYGIAQVEDITERKRAEQGLARAAAELERRATELERSNTALQQFAYAASHDLSEPLRMVSSYVQLIAKRYRGRLDSDADEFIGFAVDGVFRMQALIDGLLLYSRAGTSEYEMQLVDCSEVAKTTLTTMQTTLREAGAVVEVDPLPTVRGDETQLSQLFQNLVSNAIKFVADGPPRVQISVERQGDDWCFSVADNGIGVEPAHAERIFNVFQRLHGRGEYPGSGVGLAICKRIVERHSGRIWVESRPEGGSTFSFTIPASTEPADQLPDE